VEQQKQGKRKKKADEKCEGLMNRSVAVVVRVTGEPTEENAASSTQVVHSSNVCLVHNQTCHAQKLK